jgi:DNA-binding CsgD family transcriptional regulator
MPHGNETILRTFRLESMIPLPGTSKGGCATRARGMMKRPDWIALLEACYDVSQPYVGAWLEGIQKQAGEFFDRRSQLNIVTASYTARKFDLTHIVNSGSSDFGSWTRAMVEQPEILRMFYKGGALQSFSQDLFPSFPAMRTEALRLSGGKIQDAIGVAAHTGNGQVVALAAYCERQMNPTATERRRWPRAAAHLAAGFRLRLSLDRSLESSLVEVVLDPSGVTCDAKPNAQSARTRDILRQAVRRIDRARTQVGRREVEASLEAWQALIEGRWSLVDHFDSDGKHFILAIKNDPDHPDPRGLTLRERQSAEFLGLGQSTKCIAYTLGISEAAVSSHLTAARLKLGLRSRAELAGFFAPSGARAHLAEVAVVGEEILVGAYPLCREASVKMLTPAEREVAALLLRASTNRHIARCRGSSVNTIANQVQSIFRKLDVSSRVDLATQLQSSA